MLILYHWYADVLKIHHSLTVRHVVYPEIAVSRLGCIVESRLSAERPDNAETESEEWYCFPFSL